MEKLQVHESLTQLAQSVLPVQSQVQHQIQLEPQSQLESQPINPLQSPYPYFGGKSTIADIVWQRFGNTPNYVEPFFGSGAVLLARPHQGRYETVNDIDAYIANFWRAVQANPQEVAKHADNPVNEVDLTARHLWLVTEGMRHKHIEQLITDPHYYDAKIAGYWVYGLSCWIGGGWCGDASRTKGGGVSKRRPHLGHYATGVHRLAVRLNGGVAAYFEQLAARLRYVRVCCGDWRRVLTKTPTTNNGLTAVFLDPPYSYLTGRNEKLYNYEDGTVAQDVAKWAVENGDDERFRIAVCGYDNEHIFPDTWDCVSWKANGGYGNFGSKESQGKENKKRERIWFSPHCLKP